MKEVEGCSCIAFLYNQLIHCQLFCEHEKGLETFLLFPSWVLDSRSNTTVCVPVPWLVTGLEESESWCLFWLYIFLDNVALAVTMGLCLLRLHHQGLHFCVFAERAFFYPLTQFPHERGSRGRTTWDAAGLLMQGAMFCTFQFAYMSNGAQLFNTKVDYRCLITLSACTVNGYFAFGFKLSLFSPG